MNLVGITINHKTASVELREKLHLGKDEIVNLIPKLKENLFSEGFVLSTCNRTEVFGVPKESQMTSNNVLNFLLSHKPIDGIKPEHFNHFFSCSAVKHIFNVASGIDSLILGDSQILGQSKEAFQISEDMDFAGSIFKRLFDTTIKVGKRAIKETAIGEGAVSVSYAAVQLVEKIFANLQKKSALIIGAGETGKLAAINLRDKGIGKITITNRTFSKAEALAAKVRGSTLSFDQFLDHLNEYDIIISATSAEHLIIEKKDIESMMKKRKGNPCCLMDIALPRDVDSEVKKIDDVFYHDIDSLQIIVNQNLQKREKEVPLVEKIVLEELVNFFSWYNTLEIVPTIKSIREFFESIRYDELQKIKHKVTQDDYLKLEDMTRRMISRILHNPTMKLRELSETGIDERETATHSMILKNLFNLNHIPPNNDKDKNN
jgi:glutamyl-tRNA reductase